MKIFITLLFLTGSLLFAQTTYSYGNIDMHGGKKDSLISGNKGFSQMSSNSSSLLFEKKDTKKTIKKKQSKKDVKTK